MLRPLSQTHLLWQPQAQVVDTNKSNNLPQFMVQHNATLARPPLEGPTLTPAQNYPKFARATFRLWTSHRQHDFLKCILLQLWRNQLGPQAAFFRWHHGLQSTSQNLKVSKAPCDDFNWALQRRICLQMMSFHAIKRPNLGRLHV